MSQYGNNFKEKTMEKTVNVGMLGTGFVGDLHHAACEGWVRDAEVVAVSSPGNAKKFAQERGIANYYSDDREMLKDKEIDVVDIGIPNDLHCQVVQVFKTYQVSLENL